MDNKIYMHINRKCPGNVHVVEAGDTLYSIARKHHTRVRTLLFLNPFVDIYNLQIGEEICIPEEKKPEMPQAVLYVVKKDDNLGKILASTGMTFEELSANNPMLKEIIIKPGTILFIKPKSGGDSV